MRKLSISLIVGILALIAFVGWAPSAYASDVDFFCGITVAAMPCSGSLSSTGPTFSGTNLPVFNTTGPYTTTAPFAQFNLTFNTSTGAISLSGTGANTGQNLTGTITSFFTQPGFATGITDLRMTVTWSSIPSAVQAQLGASAGQSSIFSVAFGPTDGQNNVDHIIITALPEPGSLVLLGSGLVVVGGVLRKKIASLVSRT